SRGSIVCAIYGNEVVMNILACEGKLGYRLDDHICAAGGCIAHSYTWGQQREIDELPPVHGKVLNFLLFDHRVSRCSRGFNQGASEVTVTCCSTVPGER